MKRFKLVVFFCVFLFAALAFGQTNRWVSDGSEKVMKPDNNVVDVEIVTTSIDGWGGSGTHQPLAPKMITNPPDFAKWIGLNSGGTDSGYRGYFVYRKNLGEFIPSGTVHSRITFWGCADDSIVSVTLIDTLNQTYQTFNPPKDFSHMGRLVRLDMTDATIAAGSDYDILVTVKNVAHSWTGLVFYMSVDYDDSDKGYIYSWQSGWAVHSLPFKPTSSFDQLIDLFPNAYQAIYWEQESSSWEYLSLTATLDGELGDIVRSHSFYVLHTASGMKFVRGYPIYEQRFLDIWPGGSVSQFRDIGTVDCSIPFDWSDPAFEPVDLPGASIDTAWYYDQSSGFEFAYDIDAFGGSPNAIGYRIHCLPPGTNVRCNVDLRCYPPSLLSSSSCPGRAMTTLEAERIIQFKRDNGYTGYALEEDTSDTTTLQTSLEDREPTPLEYEEMPFPPGYFLKASTTQPYSAKLSVTATPNPFNSSVEISVSVPDETEDVSVTIYDITGKMIKELTEGEGNTFLWNGQDQKGEECPSGTYLYKVTHGDEAITDRILFVK